MLDFIEGLDYGDVPTWLASIVTSAALFITAVTVSRDSKDRRERDRREEGAQARSVQLQTLSMSGGSGTMRQDADIEVEMRFTNNSEDLIHDVVIGVDFHPPSAIIEVERERLELDHLGIDEPRVFRTKVKVRWPDGAKSVQEVWASVKATPFFEFTDIQNVRWRRDAEYRLIRVTP